MKMIEIVKLSDIFTLFNGFSGFLSIYFSLTHHMTLAVMLLCTAGLFDMIDGKVARYLGSQNKFGMELDSLADMISFGVAPAVFMIALNPSNYMIIVGLVLVGAGMLRLSRYNVSEKKDYYEGVTITPIVVLVAILFFFKATAIFYFILIPIYSALMISTFQIKKNLPVQIIMIIVTLIGFLYHLGIFKI